MPHQKQPNWKGACAGLLAGMAASWVMSKFQSVLKSGSQQEEEPANLKAAQKLSRAITSHELPESEKQAAGSALHYATGALSGAVFGAAALSVPLPAAATDALFGTAVWLIADEIVVPALGLSKQPSEYPAEVHRNALAPHLVYGVTTGLLFREILQAADARPATLRKAAITGAISGLRSMTGPFFGSRTAATEMNGSSVLHKLGSPIASRVLGLLAAGELVADKLPKIPDRIKPAPLAIRAATGGLSGAAVFSADGASPSTGAVIGAGAAIGAAFAGYYLRRAAVQKGVPDFAYALGEDALALTAGFAR